MVEIIHRFNGGYPFGLQKENELTFVDLRKQNLSEQQISDYRVKYKILKELICPNIIKLVKIMKDEHNMHLLYEYYPISLVKYVETAVNKNNNKNQNVFGHQFLNIFIVNISQIIETLIHFQIKGELLINNIAIQQQLESGVVLKMFIDPDFDCMGLRLPFSTEQPDIIKKKIQQSRNNLREYYNNEKNKLLFELQKLIKDQYKRNQQSPDRNTPNFVIKGTKLVFLKKQSQKQQKDIKKSLINENQSQHDNNEISNEPAKVEKIGDGKKDLKQKNMRKIEEIKNNLNHLYQKNKHINQETPENLSNIDPKWMNNSYPLEEEGTFKPEQILTDKQQILQGKSSQQNVKAQADKLKNSKRKTQQKPTQQKRQQEVSMPLQKKDSRSQRQQPLTFKLSQFKSENAANKQGRGNKYKMKIITSNEVQIMGVGDKKIERLDKNGIEDVKASNIQRNNKREFDCLQAEQKKSENNLENSQKQIEAKEKIKLRSSDIASNSKKINELISKLNLNSNLTQSHSDNQQIKSQVRVVRQNSIGQADNFVEKYQDKIKEAKNKAKQVLKDYAKSQKAMNYKQI